MWQRSSSKFVSRPVRKIRIKAGYSIFFVCVHFVIVHGFTSRVQWVRKCGAFECQRKYVTWAWLRSCDAVSFLRPDVQRPDGH